MISASEAVTISACLKPLCPRNFPFGPVQALQIIVLQRERKVQLDASCSLRAHLMTLETANAELQRQLVELQQHFLLSEEARKSGLSKSAASLPLNTPRTMAGIPAVAPHSMSGQPISVSTSLPGPHLVMPTMHYDWLNQRPQLHYLDLMPPAFGDQPSLPAKEMVFKSSSPSTACSKSSRLSLLNVQGVIGQEATDTDGHGIEADSVNGEATSRATETLSNSSDSSRRSTTDAHSSSQIPSMLDLLCTAAHYGGAEPIKPPCTQALLPIATASATLKAFDAQNAAADLKESGRKRVQREEKLPSPSMKRPAHANVEMAASLGAAGSLARIRQQLALASKGNKLT